MYHFCRDKYLSRQTQKFGRDKHTFVATKDLFCHDKHAIKVSLLLPNFCRGKIMFCRNKHTFCRDIHVFVLSRQK